MIDRVGAIHLVQKSSKSELSSRFFGRSKFWGAKKVEFSNGRLPPEDGSDRRETLGKRVSDDSRHFIFRRRKKIWGKQFTPIDRTSTNIESEDNANLLAFVIPLIEDRYDDIKINCNELNIINLVDITNLQKDSQDK